MDVYTCGNKPLIPTLPKVEKLFAIPMAGSDGEEASEPKVVWSHKLRGFRPPPYKAFENPLDQDLGADLLRRHYDSKTPLISDETDFQKVDIYETIDRRGVKDKILYLDGVQQSSLTGEAPYVCFFYNIVSFLPLRRHSFDFNYSSTKHWFTQHSLRIPIQRGSPSLEVERGQLFVRC